MHRILKTFTGLLTIFPQSLHASSDLYHSLIDNPFIQNISNTGIVKIVKTETDEKTIIDTINYVCDKADGEIEHRFKYIVIKQPSIPDRSHLPPQFRMNFLDFCALSVQHNYIPTISDTLNEAHRKQFADILDILSKNENICTFFALNATENFYVRKHLISVLENDK